jgi:hypothetical protein
MTGMAWLRRGSMQSVGRRVPAARAEVVDAWLDTLRSLAAARAAERAELAWSGRELRARLREPRQQALPRHEALRAAGAVRTAPLGTHGH